MAPRYINDGEQHYLTCLPVELHGCYAKMDGITLPALVEESGYDLPLGFNNWRSLSNYCEAQDSILKNPLAKINSDFPGDDIRLFMKGSQGDLLFLNFTRKDGILYHVKNHDFDNYHPVKSPVGEVLDRYFANAVRGFPEVVALT